MLPHVGPRHGSRHTNRVVRDGSDGRPDPTERRPSPRSRARRLPRSVRAEAEGRSLRRAHRGQTSMGRVLHGSRSGNGVQGSGCPAHAPRVADQGPVGDEVRSGVGRHDRGLEPEDGRTSVDQAGRRERRPERRAGSRPPRRSIRAPRLAKLPLVPLLPKCRLLQVGRALVRDGVGHGLRIRTVDPHLIRVAIVPTVGLSTCRSRRMHLDVPD
jgi:hypothetical protein